MQKRFSGLQAGSFLGSCVHVKATIHPKQVPTRIYFIPWCLGRVGVWLLGLQVTL